MSSAYVTIGVFEADTFPKSHSLTKPSSLAVMVIKDWSDSVDEEKIWAEEADVTTAEDAESAATSIA